MHSLLVGVALLAVSGSPPAEPISDRLARLIRQLGDRSYARREAASRELDALGEPALDALRKAASAEDAEVGQRAELLVRPITGRIRAAVTRKELEKLQGTWSLVAMEVNGRQIKGEDRNFVFTFKDGRWSLHANGQLSQAGFVQQIEVEAKHNAIELPITQGWNVGATALSIYAVEGDSLKYLNCGEPRATEFTTKPGDGRTYSIFRRVKPEALRPEGDSRPSTLKR